MELNSYQRFFLENLISIPSKGGTAMPGAPYGQMPRKALDFFLKEASKAGFTTGVVGDRAGFIEFGNGQKLLGIVCHLDVVPEGDGWDSDPFMLTFKDDADGIPSMFGRGIIDDKGPAAASYFAMKELLDAGKIPDNCRVRLILGTDEERTCSCVEYYAQNSDIPDFAITPDAEFPAIYCEKGILHLKVSDNRNSGLQADGGSAPNMVPARAACTINGHDIVAQGKPAHASKPDLGINAIEKLTRALKAEGIDLVQYPILKFIDDFNDLKKSVLDKYRDESGDLTSNIGILKADDSGSFVIIDLRVPYSVSLDEITEIIRKNASSYGLETEVESSMDSIYKDKKDPEIKNLTKIWETHMDKFTGFKEEYRSKFTDPLAIGGGTYARHIPNTIAFGVQAPWQQDQCHQANEHVSVSDFLQWIEIIKEFIITYNA